MIEATDVLDVVRAGALTTVQDAGRVGWAAQAVPGVRVRFVVTG
ncbi:hypothetical protein [Streptomyces sp. NPDC005969]